MKRYQFSILLVVLLFQSSTAFAWPPTYGSEFNFGNAAITKAWNERGAKVNFQGDHWDDPADPENTAAKKFAETVKNRCGEDCVVSPHPGKFGLTEYDIKFKDGYQFKISVDPACVEIMTSPETLEQIQKYEPRTQEFIFLIAHDLGLNTVDHTAHFNIGILSSFEGDPKGFLRFFINYHNSPELASGVLGQDFSNAPPISHLKAEQRVNLAKIVEDVNQGKIKTVQEVAVRIQKKVYTSTPTFDAGYHYQGISVKYVKKRISTNNDKPFELRAPRQPKSAHERTLLAELFEKRMSFEKGDSSPIAFFDVSRQLKFSDSELANRFRLYLAEMGADWDHFKELLPMKLQKIPPDVFFTGKIDWSSKHDLEVIKSYAKDISHSSWVRNRMKSYLETPEAIASGKVSQILTALKKSCGEAASASAIRMGDEFAATYLEGGPLQISDSIPKSLKVNCILKQILHSTNGSSPVHP